MSHFAFHTHATCLRVPPPQRTAQPLGRAGLAWDGANTNRPGARFGPHAIREASHMPCDATHLLLDCSPAGLLDHLGDLDDLGALALPNTGLAQMRAEMARALPVLVQRRHMVWLGGVHSVTLPNLAGPASRLAAH